MKKGLSTRITSLLLAVTIALGLAGMWVKPVQAGGPSCTSKANGNWSDPNTWRDCASGIPGIESSATIEHSVNVDQPGLAVGRIYVNNGSLTLSNSLTIFGTQNDAPAANYIYGPVSGPGSFITNGNSGLHGNITFSSHYSGFTPD